LILLAGGIASVAALVLGLLLTESVARPLRAVRDAAQRIGLGELSVRVPLNSDDEVGDLAEAFNQMAADLERNEQQRRTMMADIAHELRTPLAVIRGQVEALEDGVFPLNQENLVPIRDQTLLLARLVDDLRDLALAEAGRLPLECDEMNVADLVQRVVAAFRPQAVAKGITLTVEGRALPTIWADAQRIEQVLANLLNNAIRHTPEGGRVAIALWAKAGQIGISVQDSGPGLAPEDLPHLFDRFYRADKSRAEGRTGLGLSIARRLAQAHGGDISVASATGQGATFTVTLPAMGCRDRGDVDSRT
jgi:signal transduction histidine kinase